MAQLKLVRDHLALLRILQLFGMIFFPLRSPKYRRIEKIFMQLMFMNISFLIAISIFIVKNKYFRMTIFFFFMTAHDFTVTISTISGNT